MTRPPAAPYTAILFDLDGTIVDSAPGITATLAYTFGQLGLPIPPPAELLRWVGPPILDSFRDFAGFDAEQSAAALAIYRTKYLAEGVYDASLYPGVAEVLHAIHAAMRRYAVSTEASGSLVIVTTPSGYANALAQAIDEGGHPRIAGTLAGDNSIFIAVREGTSAASLRDELTGHLVEGAA